ncbi:MAG: hypothetical protein H0W73_01180 [Bacteroidetes bacterium]|nr:hypothetical protein [Bacteroidota bacterium]
MIKKALPYLLCLFVFIASAQTKKRNFRQSEIGLFAGASYYLGDLNPRGHFSFSKPAIGLFYRYSTHYRYAFRFGLNYGSVMGDDSKSKEFDQLERNVAFISTIYDVHAVAEFNFVDYRIGVDKHRFTMFIFAGLGGFYFNTKSTFGAGSANDLSHGGIVSPAYPKYQINIPYGIGFKWNVGRVFGFGVEWSPRKLFTDHLDHVSGEYIDGYMRGNTRTKDWYFFYGATLSLKLPKPNKPCFQDF